MGKTQSKNNDNNGEIVNNLIIEDKVAIENYEITILLAILVAIKIFELAYNLYKNHRRGLRKKYLSTPAQLNV